MDPFAGWTVWLQIGQGSQYSSTFCRDLSKEAPCREGQIPQGSPASLRPGASCPSFCSSHTQGWAFASGHPRLWVLLTSDCKCQCSLVKRQTQPRLTLLAAGLDRAWAERVTGTALPGPQPGSLHSQLREMVSSSPSALTFPPL